MDGGPERRTRGQVQPTHILNHLGLLTHILTMLYFRLLCVKEATQKKLNREGGPGLGWRFAPYIYKPKQIWILLRLIGHFSSVKCNSSSSSGVGRHRRRRRRCFVVGVSIFFRFLNFSSAVGLVRIFFFDFEKLFNFSLSVVFSLAGNFGLFLLLQLVASLTPPITNSSSTVFFSICFGQLISDV